MIVAIVNQTAPSGLVVVHEFRQALTEAAAVSDFVNSYNPALTSADWLGFDTGWSDFQRPAEDFHWEYDFDTPGLAQVANTRKLEASHILSLDSGDKAVTADGSWETLYQAVLNPYETCGAQRSALQLRFAYRSNGGAPKLRVLENEAAWSAEKTLTTQASWTLYLLPLLVDPSAGLNLYTIQGDRNAATLFELRGVTLELSRHIR